METRMMKKKRVSTNILPNDEPLTPLPQNKPPVKERNKAQVEKEQEKARTPKGGYKA